MLYPELRELETSREMIDVFKGYNHNLRIGSGEFYDMKNLSSQYYPVLSPRPQRGLYYTHPTNVPHGLISKDSLGWFEDDEFKLNKYDYTTGLKLTTGSIDPAKTTVVSMGAYVIVITRDANGNPVDKKWTNTENGEFGDIDYTFTTSADTSFEMCKMDGSEYTEEVKIQDVAPEITDEMKEAAKAGTKDLPLWIDTSKTPHSLKQFSTATSAWSSIATTYIKIKHAGIGKSFVEGDGVVISNITIEHLSDLNSSIVIQARGDDYIVVVGFIDQVATQKSPITITRAMPLMDFVIESGNRLWGCRYGPALNGEIVNEIYASKLGDFKNWNCFAQISTDSYVASVGTDGQFTGAITYLGYPIFFKENHMHKVYGNYPANYQIQTTACRGVQKGCSKSLAIVNETLYYKSRSGICTYDGSLPVEISAAFGDVSYSDAVAGALSNKYYISMMDAEETYHLFVYDSLKGMWHREDNTHALEFCTNRGDLYYIDDYDKDIKVIRGTGKADSELITIDKTPIKWEAISGIIGTDSPDKKYISRLDVRLLLTPGSTATFYAEYDSSEVWEHLHTMVGTTLRSFAVPIRPKRCDHMRLKIVGQGDAKIYSICKTIEQGSDV